MIEREDRQISGQPDAPLQMVLRGVWRRDARLLGLYFLTDARPSQNSRVKDEREDTSCA